MPAGDSSTEYSMFAPMLSPFPEIAPDRLREEGDCHDDVFEAVGLQQLDDVLHARLADDRHHRLRLVGRERAKARALAAGHDDGLHVRLLSALTT